MRTPVKPGKTPAEISVSMIDQDLKDGVSKSEMAIKYGIKPWEVDEIFKHPFLKGRRPSRKKALSFTFVDDTLPLNSGDIAVEQAEEVDPNQVTLEEAIDEAIEDVEAAKNQMQETQEAISNMLSPTELTGIPNGDTMSDTDDEDPLGLDEVELPSFEDTLDLVKEQEEEELEEDDDTFEL